MRNDDEYPEFHTEQIHSASYPDLIYDNFDDNDNGDETCVSYNHEDNYHDRTAYTDDSISPTFGSKSFLQELVSNINKLNSSVGSTAAPVGAISIPTNSSPGNSLKQSSIDDVLTETSVPKTELNSEPLPYNSSRLSSVDDVLIEINTPNESFEIVGDIMSEILGALETGIKVDGIKVEAISTEICQEYDIYDHTCMTCDCIAKIITINDSYLQLNDLQKLAVYKTRLKKIIRDYEDANEAGTSIDYRCPVCQHCPRCKESGKIRTRSIREEDEQFVIDNSIFIDYVEQKVTVKLPFLTDPIVLSITFR